MHNAFVRLCLWFLKHSSPLQQLYIACTELTCVLFNRMVTLSKDGTWKFWDIDGKQPHRFLTWELKSCSPFLLQFDTTLVRTPSCYNQPGCQKWVTPWWHSPQTAGLPLSAPIHPSISTLLPVGNAWRHSATCMEVMDSRYKYHCNPNMLWYVYNVHGNNYNPWIWLVKVTFCCAMVEHD